MAERARYVPTADQRDSVATRIKLLKEKESQHGRPPYAINSTAEGYLEALNGLKATFAYIRNFAASKRVLDIGAGNAIAIQQLSTGLGKELNFMATGLSLPQKPVPFPYYVTSGEELEGIDTESIGGAIARYSVAYSACPPMVVAAVDRVLTPGGVFKGSFFRPYDSKPLSDFRFETSRPFLDAFKSLGYDTDTSNGDGIILAIKPNPQNPSSVTALELAIKDFFDPKDWDYFLKPNLSEN